MCLGEMKLTGQADGGMLGTKDWSQIPSTSFHHQHSLSVSLSPAGKMVWVSVRSFTDTVQSSSTMGNCAR